jgi:predicted Zn-dependent protease
MDDPSWLDSARGYLDLGMLDEADAALASLTNEQRESEPGRELAISIALNRSDNEIAFRLSEELCRQWPASHAGPIQGAYALHALGRTEEAILFLQAGPGHLREEAVYYYNLACYEATLGRSEAAVSWVLESVLHDPAFRERALEDPDLAGILERLKASFENEEA